MTIKLENLNVRKVAKTKNGYIAFVETEDFTPIKIYSKKKMEYETGDIISVDININMDFFFKND